MADLIDRAALLEQLESFRKDEKWRSQRTFTERWLRTKGIDIFAEAVKKFPTVDAVPVVRCKDCKYACLVTDHDLQCLYDDDSLLHPHSHYCSYGERRTDEEEV